MSETEVVPDLYPIDGQHDPGPLPAAWAGVHPIIPGVYKKLLLLMDLCKRVSKDKANTFHNYRYSSDEAVMATVNPALVASGLIGIPHFTVLERRGDLVTVGLIETIIDPDDGTSVTVSSLGSGSDKGDKAVAKAMTMAGKYLWLKLLKIATGDDPEADSATDKAAAGPAIKMPVKKSSGTP